MYRRTVFALLAAAGTLATGSAGFAGDLAAIKLSGTGDQVSARFSLQAGLSIWQVSHEGRSNFQISLVNRDGDSVDMPINEIGRYRGVRAVRIARSGEYLLNVHADGKWSISIDQPRPTEAPAKPLEAAGEGAAVTSFVTLPRGLNVVKASHQGDGIFRVRVLDRQGRTLEQVVGVVGPYDGSRAIKIEEAGIYVFSIIANGQWSLKVE
jgi:hypothetical protein